MNRIMIKIYNRDEYGKLGEYEPIAIFLCHSFYVERKQDQWYETLHGMVDAGDHHFFEYPLMAVSYEVYFL